MKAIAQEWTPRNEYTTPLTGQPDYRNEGIIVAVAGDGENYSVGEIAFETYGEVDYQYIITPYWHVIDALPASIFQGIPGIDMQLRLPHYYRVNYDPIFITERTPTKGREDLWELLDSVGLNYYDRLEWLIRTDLRASCDNLIVERKLDDVGTYTVHEQQQLKRIMAYAGKVREVVLKKEDILGKTADEFSDNLVSVLAKGCAVKTMDDSFSIETEDVPAVLGVLLKQKELKQIQYKSVREKGIEWAKREGKYKGRKKIAVDDIKMDDVLNRLDAKEIDVETAMKELGLTSRSTFYRRKKEYLLRTENLG